MNKYDKVKEVLKEVGSKPTYDNARMVVRCSIVKIDNNGNIVENHLKEYLAKVR